MGRKSNFCQWWRRHSCLLSDWAFSITTCCSLIRYVHITWPFSERKQSHQPWLPAGDSAQIFQSTGVVLVVCTSSCCTVKEISDLAFCRCYSSSVVFATTKHPTHLLHIYTLTCMPSVPEWSCEMVLACTEIISELELERSSGWRLFSF